MNTLPKGPLPAGLYKLGETFAFESHLGDYLDYSTGQTVTNEVNAAWEIWGVVPEPITLEEAEEIHQAPARWPKGVSSLLEKSPKRTEAPEVTVR